MKLVPIHIYEVKEKYCVDLELALAAEKRKKKELEKHFKYCDRDAWQSVAEQMAKAWQFIKEQTFVDAEGPELRMQNARVYRMACEQLSAFASLKKG